MPQKPARVGFPPDANLAPNHAPNLSFVGLTLTLSAVVTHTLVITPAPTPTLTPNPTPTLTATPTLTLVLIPALMGETLQGLGG